MALISCDFYSDALEVNTSMTVILPQETETQIGGHGPVPSGPPRARPPSTFNDHDGVVRDTEPVNEPTWPSITAVRMNGARHRAELPLLVLGPAVGTSAATLWADPAGQLVDAFDVLAWDLPGHGYNQPPPEEPFTVAELAGGVLAVVDDVLAERGELDGSFAYAGVGIGGEVGVQLQRDAPARIRDVVVLGEAPPDDAARVIRRRLLGEDRADDDLDARARLSSTLASQVEAARASGVSDSEIRELLRQVESTLDD